MIVTAEIYLERTGSEPMDDDLERVNCPRAGVGGHTFCGWCRLCGGPVTQCGHTIDPEDEDPVQ